MIALEQISSLKDYLQTAQTALVILGPKPTDDQLSVASAIYLGMTALGKDAGIYAPKQLDSRGIVGLEDLSTKLGKQNLVVEFDYEETAVDKVSYHISEETNKFYLTIKPKKGEKPLDKSNVELSYAGADADLVFLVGVHDLEALGRLYHGYESLYDNAFVVALHSFKPELGNIQFDLSGASSMSESVVGLLDGLDIELNADMATDLLSGIERMTDSLQSRSATAETFETVARLLRAGARRQRPAENNEDQKQKSDKPKSQDIVIKKSKKNHS
jgi:hypothetical protein